MGYFYTYILAFLQFIKIVIGELSIETYAEVNGTQTLIFGTIGQQAGANLTLICKLKNSKSSSHFDHELSWGKLQKNVHFNDRHDMSQFISKNDVNHTSKHFYPLLPHDSGTYFCLSHKYQLSKIVKLHVSFDLKSKLNRSKNRRSLHKHDCASEGAFACMTGTACIDSIYICDNVKDCSDGSDENASLCGDDPCFGKRQCSTGRCLPDSLCCDKGGTSNCAVTAQHLCCLENNTNKNDVQDQAVTDSNQKTNRKGLTNFQIMWIVVICAIFLVFITMFIVLIQSRSKLANANMATRYTTPTGDNRRSHRNTSKTTSFTYNPAGSV